MRPLPKRAEDRKRGIQYDPRLHRPVYILIGRLVDCDWTHHAGKSATHSGRYTSTPPSPKVSK